MPDPRGGNQQRLPPKTASSRGTRPKGRKGGNSLNLQAPRTQSSQQRLEMASTQNQTALLGRIEQNKYITEKDSELEAVKLDEGKRRQRLEQVNYKLFSEDLVNGGTGPHDTSGLGSDGM